MKSFLSSHFFWVLLAFIFSFDGFANENDNPYQTPGTMYETPNNKTCAFAFLNTTLPREEITDKIMVRNVRVSKQEFKRRLASLDPENVLFTLDGKINHPNYLKLARYSLTIPGTSILVALAAHPEFIRMILDIDPYFAENFVEKVFMFATYSCAMPFIFVAIDWFKHNQPNAPIESAMIQKLSNTLDSLKNAPEPIVIDVVYVDEYLYNPMNLAVLKVLNPK